MEKIDEIIYKQYFKFNNLNDINEDEKKIINNFIDELMSCHIMIYIKFDENGLKMRDVYKYDDIKDNIKWNIENNLKIPYLNDIKIKAIRFSKNNLDQISNFVS